MAFSSAQSFFCRFTNDLTWATGDKLRRVAASCSLPAPVMGCCASLHSHIASLLLSQQRGQPCSRQRPILWNRPIRPDRADRETTFRQAIRQHAYIRRDGRASRCWFPENRYGIQDAVRRGIHHHLSDC